jgi:arylsulfatase A-like enzyme
MNPVFKTIAAVLPSACMAEVSVGLPNIVVFIADDAGLDFGCYGNSGIKTPRIDALAGEGLRFDQAFVTTPQCSPCRTSILSGRYAHSIGTEDLHVPLPDGVPLVPSFLREKGYYTGMMLKSHLGPHGSRQFDWYDEGERLHTQGQWNDLVLANTRTFLDQAGSRPFLLWVGFKDPHRPYDNPLNKAPEVHGPEQVKVPSYLADTPETRSELALYYDAIHRMDGHIGLIVDELKQRGLYEHTLIVFFSDNGMPFPRAKGTLYDSGIQTPMIMTFPGRIRPGTVCPHLVSTIDLAPTFLRLAGLEPPQNMMGVDLRPLFDEPTIPVRDEIFAERNWHDTDAHMRCVRTSEYKLIFNGYPLARFPITGDQWQSPSWDDLRARHRIGRLTDAQAGLFLFPRPQFELYDIKQDPDEIHNLAGAPDYADRLEALYGQMQTWMVASDDYPPHKKRRMDLMDRETGFFFGIGEKRREYSEHY